MSRLESLIRTYEQERREEDLAAIFRERMRVGDLPEINVALAGNLRCAGAKLIYPPSKKAPTPQARDIYNNYFNGTKKQYSLVINMCYDFINDAKKELEKEILPTEDYILKDFSSILEAAGRTKRTGKDPKLLDLHNTLIGQISSSYEHLTSTFSGEHYYSIGILYEALEYYIGIIFFNVIYQPRFAATPGADIDECTALIASIYGVQRRDMVCGYLLG